MKFYKASLATACAAISFTKSSAQEGGHLRVTKSPVAKETAVLAADLVKKMKKDTSLQSSEGFSLAAMAGCIDEATVLGGCLKVIGADVAKCASCFITTINPFDGLSCDGALGWCDVFHECQEEKCQGSGLTSILGCEGQMYGVANCFLDAVGCTDQTCEAPDDGKPIGASCEADEECASGICAGLSGYKICSLIDVPEGKLPGASCEADEECATGSCVEMPLVGYKCSPIPAAPVPAPPTAAPVPAPPTAPAPEKKSFGQWCETDEECISENCFGYGSLKKCAVEFE